MFIGTKAKTRYAKMISAMLQKAYILFLPMKYLLKRKAKVMESITKTTFNGFKEISRFVCEKKVAISTIKEKTYPQSVKRKLKNGMPKHNRTHTHRTGKIKENIGTKIKLAKRDKMLICEYMSAKNGKIKTWADMDMEKESATNFGKIFLKIVLKNG